MELLISACTFRQFTCDNGRCINKYKRCNLITDCEDQSDEKGCNLLILPKSYSRLLPPPTLDSNALPIKFAIGITAIREFNLLKYSISVDMTLRLEWRDARY